MTRRKGKAHRVAPKGPAVFPADEDDPRRVVLIQAEGVTLRGRFPKGRPVKDISPEQYCGDEPPKGAA